MNNWFLHEYELRQRQAALAEQDRDPWAWQSATAAPERYSSFDRLLCRVGGLLVRWGDRLQMRASRLAAATLVAERRPSPCSPSA
jgi:hypothetical protein